MKSRTLRLDGDSVEARRRELRDYFCQTFDLTSTLFEQLHGDRAWFEKSIPLRHSLIFYFCHTAAFLINKLRARGFVRDRVDASIERTVAIGVDEMSWDDLDETQHAWPTVAEARAYRAEVRARVVRFIDEMPLSLPISWLDPAWLILMGIEHERIHVETSSVLIRQLPIEAVRVTGDWPPCPLRRATPEEVPPNELVAVSGSAVNLGKAPDDRTFGWDNEYGVSVVQLAAFKASRMLVSNAEYLAFVLDGGYSTSAFWTDEGWRWCQYARATIPTFWVLRDRAAGDEGARLGPGDVPRLRLRTMAEEIPMPWDWPVEVNQLEAAAFCRWKSAKTGRTIQLPSEAEWHALRDPLPWDQPTWREAPGNINLEHWASACPVDRFRQGELYDVVGNVWQWTSTPIAGFPGYKVHPAYDDFSTPTFDGLHVLMKGGSWCSSGNEALRSARYAFRRHFFQHAGFRYVESSYAEPEPCNPYERDLQVSQYLSMHYGPEHLGVTNYAAALAALAAEHAVRTERALDLGCAVGRASFELARHFDHVDGVDFSARFIDVALQLARRDVFRYSICSEGELNDFEEVRLAHLGITPQIAARVRFTQGDAHDLKPRYADYDLVLAANLIDRLRDPARFLRDLAKRVRPGGHVVLSSPYTWSTDFTPRDHWLGGYRENGEAVTTLHTLHHLLDGDFERVGRPRDVPFVIRETARKFQHTVAQATVWRRR